MLPKTKSKRNQNRRPRKVTDRHRSDLSDPPLKVPDDEVAPRSDCGCFGHAVPALLDVEQDEQ